jgi:hypothetical protein
VRLGAFFEIPDFDKDGNPMPDLPAGSTKDLTIKLKIDIRRFLPLSNLKYLPKFVGNFELRVRFSTAGLVCAPLPVTDVFQTIMEAGRLFVRTGTGVPVQISSCFVPMGQQFTMLGTITYSDLFRN